MRFLAIVIAAISVAACSREPDLMPRPLEETTKREIRSIKPDSAGQTPSCEAKLGPEWRLLLPVAKYTRRGGMEMTYDCYRDVPKKKAPAPTTG